MKKLLLIFLTISLIACNSSVNNYTPAGYYFKSKITVGIKIESFTYIAPNGKFYSKTYSDGELALEDEGTWNIVELSTTGLTNKKTGSFIIFKNGRKFIMQIFDDCFGLPETGYEKSIIGIYIVPESDYISSNNIWGSPFNALFDYPECFEKTTKHSKLFEELFANDKIENEKHNSDKIISEQATLTNEKSDSSTNSVLKNSREEPLITPENNHLIKDMWIGIQKSHNMLNKSGEEMIIRGNKVVMPETQHKIRFYPDNIVEMEQIYGYTNDKYKGLYSGESIGWISAEFSLQPEEQYEYAVNEVADEKEIKVDELTNEIKKLKYTFSYSGKQFDYLKVRSSNGIEFKAYRESSGRWKKKVNTKVEDTSIPEIIEIIEDEREDERGAGIDEVEEVQNAVVGNIHISIRNFKASIFSFKTSKFLIRIDELEDKTFRYSSWNKNSSFNDKPDLTLNNGERFYEGSGGNNYFLFKSGAYSYQIWENKVSNKTSDYTLKVYRNEDLLGEYESVK
jgi:hypothetical protein